VEQGRFLIAPEQIDNIVQPFREIGPINDAGILQAIWSRVETGQQGLQLWVDDLFQGSPEICLPGHGPAAVAPRRAW
jgi:hypothetical protein